MLRPFPSLIDETYLMFWIGVTSYVLLLFIVYAYMYILWKAHSHAVRMIQRGTQKGHHHTHVRRRQGAVALAHGKPAWTFGWPRPDPDPGGFDLCWGPLLAIMVYDVFGKMNKLIKTVFAFYACSAC